MHNTKFPNAEYVNYLCQTVIDEQIYKIIKENYLKNIINIETSKIIQEADLLILTNYNIIEKITLVKALIRDAQNRAAKILDGRVPEVLCAHKFKYKIFNQIFKESYCKAEKQILNAINVIFLKELKKTQASSIEEYHAALQYFISASSNLAIDTLIIKASLKKALEKYLNQITVPLFKENATIVGQAGKETIKTLQRANALTNEEILKYIH
jgi:hypothetical protein